MPVSKESSQNQRRSIGGLKDTFRLRRTYVTASNTPVSLPTHASTYDAVNPELSGPKIKGRPSGIQRNSTLSLSVRNALAAAAAGSLAAMPAAASTSFPSSSAYGAAPSPMRWSRSANALVGSQSPE